MFKRILFLIMFATIYLAPAYAIHKLIVSLYPIKHIYFFSFIFLTFGLIAFPLGSFLNRIRLHPINIAIERIGGFFLFYYTYAIIALIFYLILCKLHPNFAIYFRENKNIFILGFWLVLTTLGIVGYRRAHNIRVTNYTLNSNKIKEKKRIVFFSDIHFSAISTKYIIEDLVEVVNKLDADYILIPGDIIDTDIKVIYYDYIEEFNKLKAKNGIYASIGNHEYYGSFDDNIDYIRKLGIVPLLDQSLEVEDFNLIGRLYDYSPRKSLNELREGLDLNRDTIIMDHKPGKIEELIDHNIFLQVSGHTHHGQFFPYNLFTKFLFKPHWGIFSKGETNIITSCGLGYWAIPIRFPSYAEVVAIDIKN